MNFQAVKTSNKQELLNLYYKAKGGLRKMEVNLSKNFSITLLNNCYKVKALIKDLENILGVGIIQIPQILYFFNELII